MQSRCWHNRATALGLTLAFLIAARVLLPDPVERESAIYLAVVTFGYGHLLGPLLSRRGRPAAPRARLLVGAGLVLLFVVYLHALESWPGLLLLMLAIGGWHTLENDLRLQHIYAREPSGAAARSTPSAVAASVVVAGVLWWIVALGERAHYVIPEVFAASTLYHLVSWLLVFSDRAATATAPERRQIHRRLLLAHVPAAVLVLLLQGASMPALEPLRVLATAPGVYQFFGALHVVQTFWRSGPRR